MKLRNRAIAFIVTIAMVLNNILSPASVWYGDQHALAAESRDATSSSASGQTTGNGGASNASDSSPGTAASGSQPATPLVLKKSVTAGKEPAPGEPDTRRTYAVQVTCDASAGVPEGAVLEVSEIEAKDEQKKAAREQLKLAENDRVVAETYIRVVIKDGDSVIQPATPVDVVVETASMAPTYSDAVEAVVLGEMDTAVTVENLTGRRDDGTEDEKPAITKLKLKTDKLGDLALATVVTPFDTRSYDGQTIALLGPRTKHTTVDEDLYDDYEVDGKTLLRTVTFRTEPEHAWHPTLWVESRLEGRDLASGTVGCWRWQDGHATTKVFGGTGTSSPTAIASDSEYAFMTERTQTTGTGDQPGTELNPDAGASVDSTPAPSAATPEAATPTAAEGSKQAQPVTNDQPDEAAARKQAQDQARAEAEQVVAVRSLKKVYTASDGKTYRVTVGNDDTTFDANVELDVREVAEGSVEYLDYVAKAGKELGAPPSNVAYAKALDITLRNTVTGKESHPSENVRVLIELLDADFKPSDQVGVVHFGEKPETMNAVVAGNTVSFQTNSFSVYTILATASAPKLTVKNIGVMSTSEGALAKEFLSLDGSWARWKVTVNPNAEQLNSNASLILEDTFDDGVATDARQSIDYSSINVESSNPVNPVTYDYSGNTGTFIIPDGTTVTITYRTRIAAQAGEKKTFHGTARLKLGSAGEPIATATAGTADDGIVVYPSASDVAGFGTNYMIKVFAYADGSMQTGLEGAKFILMDASKRPLEYKVGNNAGQPVTFTTDSNGYVNVQLDEEPGDVAIEKNTGYHLEMIKAPEGYQKDNTLYSFMITDDPSYESGGFYKYYNGDTMKVRLYVATPGLKVSIRFSGSYNLTDSQKNNVTAVLQRYGGRDSTGTDIWTEVKRYAYTDTNEQNTIVFDAELSPTDRYRVVEENEKPWDLPDDIYLYTNYYCVKNDGESDKLTDTVFSVDDSSDSVTFVIDNRYEEPQLTISKMNKSTGELLPGAVFQVFKIQNGVKVGDVVKEYTTDAEGKFVIRGGDPYESETLYGVVETTAPEHYLLPLVEDWHYFYFCNDEYLEPTILANLPAGATATNLTNSGDNISLDNQLEKVTIPVMKLWQGNEWPQDTTVVVGLYQSVDREDPQPVKEGGVNRTVTLSSANPYNNTAFTNLPSRDDQNRNIKYSIKEESINGRDPLKAGYVQEYGVSDAGVYVVRNKLATSLKVSKEWCEREGRARITNSEILAAQSSVTFDIYRTTDSYAGSTSEDGIAHADMKSFIASATKVREGLTFGNGDNWETTISDLDKWDDLGNLYHYYIMETVPSFGDEHYKVIEASKTEGANVTIKNKVAPDAENLTVTKAELVNDPRVESDDTDFGFTLKLYNGTGPIRSWKVTDNLATDTNGEVRFSLKPTSRNPAEALLQKDNKITFSLPEGVSATLTEDANSEYTTRTAMTGGSGTESDNGRSFTYDVASENDNATLTYTNTLRVVCKVVNDAGTELPFESIKSALARLRNPQDGETFTSPWKIYMLEDYEIPTTDIVNVTAEENITLTTSEGGLFPFKGGAESDRATITRAGNGSSMITNEGTLTLGNIILNGNKDNYTVTGNGGLINSNGTLNLNSGTTLCDSATNGVGGAIHATGTVNMVDGVSITGNTATSASALYLDGTLNMSGGSVTDNTGATDGAVVVKKTTDKVILSGGSRICDNTNAQGNAANLYIGYDNDRIVDVAEPGFTQDAQIGVTAMSGHMEIGDRFATADVGSSNLNRFINDAYGYRGKLQDGTSTNVVWDGLTIAINKAMTPVGANPADDFTITLTSENIKKSTYNIDGTLDYTVTAAWQNRPGTIELRGVKAGKTISISPLPVGEYTVSESSSNYGPSYIAQDEVTGDAITVTNGTFTADNNSVVTVTNTRRLADVKLTKTLEDKLVTGTVDFPFTLKLAESDGTPIKGFELAAGVTTNDDGEAHVTLSPTTSASAVLEHLAAPVGATMTFTEGSNSNYRVNASATAKGTGSAITDGDEDNDNVFVISSVTDDGANVTFKNVRKMAGLELRKELVGKVSTEESFTMRMKLLNANGTPAANYIMHEKDDDYDTITTDANGMAIITYTIGKDESAKSVNLNLPEGTKLTVEEDDVKKSVGGTEQSIYDTKYSIDGASAQSGRTATINSLSERNESIVFTNTRKTRTITVKNTVGGYSGNVNPFRYTATITDGNGNAYDDNGFDDGVQTFELTKDQNTKELVVPYGATLKVEQEFVVGYETTVKRGNDAAVVKTSDEFQVSQSLTEAFTNKQLIGLQLANSTPSKLTDVTVTVGYGNKIYRVKDDKSGQDLISSNKEATLDIEPGQTAILEIEHEAKNTAEQTYVVEGNTPADGYYYTIVNEPSFHEFADPAVLRVYNFAPYGVGGKLRYSVEDSKVTFSAQPLVSYDINGGVWTTEMEGYHDKDNNRKIYQYAVNSGEMAPNPSAYASYSTAKVVNLLGWEKEDGNLYNFDTPVSGPITLKARWDKEASDYRTVSIKNGTNVSQTFSVTVNGAPASYTIAAGSAENINNVPNGAKMVITPNTTNLLSVSAQYEDGDTSNNTFTINSVTCDGTVAFTSGICKITDDADAILYKADGTPAVYPTLEDAFSDYNGNLYTDASHVTTANQAKVKMLIDEYVISKRHTFPNKDVILTTAKKDDQDYPYVGNRDRASLYRDGSFSGETLFSVTNAKKATLTNIILDGKEVKLAKAANGGLIHVNKSGAELNIKEGTYLRSVQYSDYTDSNNSRGGAIYVQNGTLNVNAGLFKNLHARNGGAIYVNKSANAIMNLTGTEGSTRFEDCCAESSGGAIEYRGTSALAIDGGSDNGFKVDAEGKTQFDAVGKKIEVNNPGITFSSCSAKSNETGNGGAIYIDSTGTCLIKGCSFTECSSKVNKWDNRQNGGGGIAAINIDGMTVSNCTFDACDTLTDGGAVFARIKNATSMDINNCIFNNDSCKGQGGAISVYQMTEGNRSTSRLTINGCRLESCSSGTSNGSGGAIQSYLPCMSLINSDFTDCWAGKEGGAVNHFYDGSFDTIWSETELYVSGCDFTRCRAEDRYDPAKPQHYAGGINSKAYKATIEDSKFTDCVSTLREGGALHLGGRDVSGISGSNATISRSTFINCVAKTAGGAVLASTYNLTVEDSFFYGCKTSGKAEGDNTKPAEDGGGAISHSQNRRNNSTQNETKITNCVFSNNPDGGEDAQSCSTVTNGGAIWTRAKSVTIDKCTINECTANGNGGAVYLYKNGSQTATISGETVNNAVNGTITNCTAVSGSAVYVSDKATFSGVSITGNTCSEKNSGAVHGVKLYFEGNVKVEGNTCSSDDSCNHDVLMQNDNVTTIYTTANGLGIDANIGVYVPDTYFSNRGTEGKAFGTWAAPSGGSDPYLERFFNDRDAELFGCKLADSDNKIYWGTYVCKITDGEGNTLTRPNGLPAVYQRISFALNEFTSVRGGDPVYVKMLVENYSVKTSTEINNFPATSVTLTTAGKGDSSHPYKGTEGTVCTISRTNSTKPLFHLKESEATFQLENITLDGRKNKTSEQGDYGLITADAGNLVINSGTTLQYGSANHGGAIFAQNPGTSVTVNGVYDGTTKEPTVKFINCKATSNGNGGAINAHNGATLNITNTSKTKGEYGTSFINCFAGKSGGALRPNGSTVSIDGVDFQNCHCTQSGGALFHDNDTEETHINNCRFEECYTLGDVAKSFGGAVTSKAETLTIVDGDFVNCRADSNGGAVNHGESNVAPTATNITNTTFDGCKTTGGNGSYSFGGSVYTRATNVVMTGSTISGSMATNEGGALYLQNNSPGSTATITNTTFANCSTSKTSGGAIFSNGMNLTLDGTTTISRCTAPSYSGAVHMYNAGSNLTVKGNTLIGSDNANEGCYANLGAAVYLNPGVTMTLEGSPEFKNNGYNSEKIVATNGACIYLEQGSTLKVSGSPKFSRNILPDRPRIANGAITNYVRQDIYLAGYVGEDATSIHITGDVTGDDIWVWPEQSPHRLPGEQFAVMDDPTVTDETLSHFHNALADDTTHCSKGEYLAGVRINEHNENVYWDKVYTVKFDKIDNKKIPVAGAGFTLYKDIECTNAVGSATSADGFSQTDSTGELLPRGTVAFSSTRIGAYYMRETAVPASYKENNATYLVLVGTPFLSPNPDNKELWEEGGPLDETDAATLVARHTTEVDKYYAVFPLDENNKAILRANLASNNVGIENIRNDYEVSFMKEDDHDKPLPGAAFTIYAPILNAEGEPETFGDGYPQLMRWTRDGENYPDPVVSADGKNDKDINGNTLDKGTVYFRELPEGTYYLLETGYPERNGDNRRAYYEESDRVFRLQVEEVVNEPGKVKATLSEWRPTPENKTRYVNLPDNVVTNREVVCKLTDRSNNLLYSKGHEIWDINGEKETISYTRLFPAIYPTLEAGFDSAQTGSFAYSDGTAADDDDLSSIKLQALKDFTLTEPITYNTSNRALTFTTASTTATKDRYVFNTTRTRDTARAEIKRGYSDAMGALVTVDNNAGLSLTNINLNGMKGYYSGRAVRVANGTLNIIDNTLMQDFQSRAEASDLSVRGGAVLMDSGTRLNVDGGSNRSAVFSGNSANRAAVTAEGGAIALSDDCTVSINNVQFTDNSASGSGGAISVGNNHLAITNGVFISNSAPTGGAIHVGANGVLSLTDGSFTGNIASIGAAIYVGDAASLTITNGSITGNTATDPDPDGGAINLADNTARIYLDGSPTIFDNTDESSQQRNVVLSVDSNGVINTTGDGLTGGNIGVYVSGDTTGDLFKAHGKASMPFGTFGDASSKQYADVFKNDRIAELYGTWNQDDPSDNFIYWIGAAGVDFTFTKIDSYGTPLNDAVFTLYNANDNGSDILKDRAGNEVAVENAVATSRTVTNNEPVTVSVVQSDGTVAQKQVWGDGLVSFETIPAGTYFVKETTFPKVDPNDSSDNAPRYRAIETNYKYKVVLGEEGVVTMFVEDGTDGAGNISWSAVPTSPVQTTTDGVTVNLHTTLNVHPNERRVILRKVSEDDNTFTSLGGAKFRVYRADWSQIRDEEYESDGQSGVYFIDTLPYGKYRLVETVFPSGYAPDGYGEFNASDASTYWYYDLYVGDPGQEIDELDENGNKVKLDGRGTYVSKLKQRNEEIPTQPVDPGTPQAQTLADIVTNPMTWPTYSDLPVPVNYTIGMVFKEGDDFYVLARDFNETWNEYSFKPITDEQHKWEVVKYSGNRILTIADLQDNSNGSGTHFALLNLNWGDVYRTASGKLFIIKASPSHQDPPTDDGGDVQGNWIRLLI